ncbi:MAG: hypothetical protein WAQ98_03605 [Blastocatellia bacterium]
MKKKQTEENYPTSSQMLRATLGSQKQQRQNQQSLPLNNNNQQNDPFPSSDQPKDQKIEFKDQFEVLRSKDFEKNERNSLQNHPELSPTSLQYNHVAQQPSHENQAIIQPSHITTRSQHNQVVMQPSRITTTIKLNNSNWYKLYNDLEDYIIPTLDIYEQSVFRRVYRLSYGFNRDTTDSVSASKLAEKCNIGVSKVKEAIKSLEAKGYIQVFSDRSGNPKGGNKYRINVELPQESTINQGVIQLGHNTTRSQYNHIKDHDDDPLKRQDHHQSTVPNINDHQKRVMMIYQEVTGNLWSKADHSNYDKIKHISIEKIEIALRLAYDRATNRPNSFAFFIKEILASLNPKTQSRSNRKKAMQKIVERVRNASVGSNISPSEFVHKVKEACLREDVAFDNDLFDEILSKA